jgi:hypothetical protein
MDRTVRSRSRLGVRFVGEEARHQRVKLLVRRRSQTHEPSVQALEFRFAHRVEVDTRSGIGWMRPLQPAEKDLGCARVTNRPLAQPTLDFCVAGPLTVTTCGATNPDGRRAMTLDDVLGKGGGAGGGGGSLDEMLGGSGGQSAVISKLVTPDGTVPEASQVDAKLQPSLTS